MKNKIILLVELPSACGGVAYTLAEEMIKRGFQYMPVVTTDKHRRNVQKPEAVYIDEEKFQSALLKQCVPLYGDNNGIRWGITYDIIEKCATDTGKYFMRLNLADAIKLKKEDPSSFAIVCILEYVNIHTSLSIYDIDMYISGVSISKTDIDRRLELIDELVVRNSLGEQNISKDNINPMKEIVDVLYNKEQDKYISAEASNIVTEAMLEHKLKELHKPYSFKKIGKKLIYKLQIDKDISVCLDVIHHDCNCTTLSVEIYLEKKLPLFDNPKKMDALYSLLNQINVSYFAESVCAIHNMGVIAVINLSDFSPYHSTNTLEKIFRRTFDLVEDMMDIRNLLKGTTTLEKEMKKRNVWMRKL